MQQLFQQVDHYTLLAYARAELAMCRNLYAKTATTAPKLHEKPHIPLLTEAVETRV